MSKKVSVTNVEPELAIEGGEIVVRYELSNGSADEVVCLVDGIPAKISAASNNRLLARVPEGLTGEDAELQIAVGEDKSDPIGLKVGLRLCENMHIVANPAVDPTDGSVVITRSGTRGQELPSTLFRLRNGIVEEMEASVMNPTGLAFDSTGRLFVTNRADGEVLQINNDSEVVPLAADLGVATGLAFDSSDNLFVGDRSGKIYKISGLGDAREWSQIEPSVSAFHMAFGPSGNLFVAAPGLCSYDVIHELEEKNGKAGIFFKGLGRPQGLAFDEDGNLYVAACLRGRHGIVKISNDGADSSLWIAGMSIVGLCFDSEGKVLVATSDSLYSLNTGTYGILV